MTSFQERIEAAHEEYNEIDSDDFAGAESNARARMYEEIESQRGICLAAYHLWENGHVQGDATDEEMQNDAIALGINVVEDGWEDQLFSKLDEEFLRRFDEELEQLLTKYEHHEEYVVLTCTAHGKSVWMACPDPDVCGLPDRDVKNPPPARVLGPYRIGYDGYENAEEAVENDPEISVDLNDTSTWFDDPDWLLKYIKGEEVVE